MPSAAGRRLTAEAQQLELDYASHFEFAEQPSELVFVFRG